MHHVVLERWSRGSSVLHACDARVKVVLLLGFLIALATTTRLSAAAAAPYVVSLAIGIAASGLPAGGLLGRAAVVLPVSVIFAVFSVMAGDSARAAALVLRSYLSAVAVLLVAGTTPLPQFLRALESLGVPSFLVLVVQFLYRYLFVISEQAQHMRQAAACRGRQGGKRGGFRAASGAVTVLFARSYDRAQGIHAAMLSRSFDGRMRLLEAPRARFSDALILLSGAALIAASRIGAEAVR